MLGLVGFYGSVMCVLRVGGLVGYFGGFEVWLYDVWLSYPY